MIELFGAVLAMGFFGLVTQRSILGALLSLQVMTTATILFLVILARTGHVDVPTLQAAMSGRARDASLVFMVVFQIQALAALAYVTRQHYLRLRTGMNDLTTMRN